MTILTKSRADHIVFHQPIASGQKNKYPAEPSKDLKK